MKILLHYSRWSCISCAVGLYGEYDARGWQWVWESVAWLLSGFIVDLSIQLTLVFWQPAVNEEYVLYILSGLWGMSDGVWQTQISGLYWCTRLIIQYREYREMQRDRINYKGLQQTAHPWQRPPSTTPLNRDGLMPDCCQSTWQVLWNSAEQLE